jgi:nicotinamidase-related amidase
MIQVQRHISFIIEGMTDESLTWCYGLMAELLVGSRQKDLQTLQRCYEQQEEGGALVVNIQAEYTDPEAWARWLPEHRQALREPWPEPRPGRPTSDGGELRSFFRKPGLLLMLQAAGFRHITVTGDYTNKPVTADHSELIFTAVRQES